MNKIGKLIKYHTLNEDKILNKLVIEEAKNLKLRATPEEIGRLSRVVLNSKKVDACIYGQMTGDCFSKRATTLIIQCCERVFKTDGTRLRGKLNGSPLHMNRNHYWSPIEIFIDKVENKITRNDEALIAYLKGETETLNFKEYLVDTK